MKHHKVLLAVALLITSACSHEPSKGNKISETTKVDPIDKSCDHILAEAYDEERSVHYFDKNVLIYKRMVLNVSLNDRGQLFVQGQPASFDLLKEEMNKFYFVNRDLGPVNSKLYKEDGDYRFKNYPFFNYFDKSQFQSYLDRMEQLAQRDSTARRHYLNHQNRLKSYEAVPEGTTLPFIEFGALISITYSEATESSAITNLETKIAENICAFRDEIAEREFNVSYYEIRSKATKEIKASYQLVCLQEMVPAYIMKGAKKKHPLQLEPLQAPPPPPPFDARFVEEEEISEN